MKFVGLKEAKVHLSKYVDRAQEDRIVITRRGKPAALVIGVEGQDIEQVILGSDVAFWKMIEQRRKRAATLTSNDTRRYFGVKSTTERPGSPRKGKPSR